MSKGLMGLDAPSDGYEGVIQVGMMRIPVQDGRFSVQGKTFEVSKGGEVTLEGQTVGRVQDGHLIAGGQ